MIKYKLSEKEESSLEEWFCLNDLPHIMILEKQHKIKVGDNEKFRKTISLRKLQIVLSSKHWIILSNGLFAKERITCYL